jgi:hypothetical protein
MEATGDEAEVALTNKTHHDEIRPAQKPKVRLTPASDQITQLVTNMINTTALVWRIAPPRSVLPRIL